MTLVTPKLDFMAKKSFYRSANAYLGKLVGSLLRKWPYS